MGGISGLLSAVALLGFLLFLAGIGLVVVSASQGRSVRNGIGLAVLGLIGGVILSVISQGIIIVEPQQVAVVFQTLSGELEEPKTSGTHIIVPVLQQATVYDVSVQEYTMSGISSEGAVTGDDAVRVRTIDGQEVFIDMTVLYRVDPLGVNIVHQRWQQRYQADFVRPVLRGFVRDVVSRFRAEAVFGESRTEIQQSVETLIRERMQEEGMELNDLVVRNVTFNEEFANSIEQVQIAEQRALEAAFRVQEQEQEAERERVKAQGERDANIARAEGEAQAIILRAQGQAEALRLVSEQIAANPSLIQYEYIQSLAPNVNLALVPSNSPFLFDFESLADPDAEFIAPEVNEGNLPGLTDSTGDPTGENSGGTGDSSGN